MATYRCQCGNIKLRKEPAPSSGKEEEEGGGGGSEDESGGRNPVAVEVLFPSLSKTYSNGTTRCLVCNVNVYKTLDGDKSVQVLVSAEGEGECDHESPAFSPSLGLLLVPSTSSTFSSPSRPRRFPAPPAVPSSYAQPTTLLQTAPEPFFLPPPFSPSHPAFHSLTLKVDDHLRLERQHLVDEIASFLDAKRQQFQDLQDKTRQDVEQVWKLYEDGQSEREEEEQAQARTGGEGIGGDGGEKVVEGVATPIKTTERFPKELEMNSSTLPRPVSSTSVGSYKAGFVLPPLSSTTSNSSSTLIPRISISNRSRNRNRTSLPPLRLPLPRFLPPQPSSSLLRRPSSSPPSHPPFPTQQRLHYYSSSFPTQNRNRPRSRVVHDRFHLAGTRQPHLPLVVVDQQQQTTSSFETSSSEAERIAVAVAVASA
ncbi:hypothetical protein BDY24DRAFT_206139 [Mrakia frigida]|uniref:uncharacterized protein n=1 Tax=Mrakia frigida TaxID=29902 RepID=UPI003FCC0D34